MDTKTKIATAIELELAPEGATLSLHSTLEEDAHYLRVTLDKSENMKSSAGARLADMLTTKFGGNRNALRDWYEAEVANGQAHRAWSTVEKYLGTVLRHGERAPEVFAERAEARREYQQKYDGERRAQSVRHNEINNLEEEAAIKPRILNPLRNQSEYEQRAAWLSLMDYTWFKGRPEWQTKWLENRELRRN